MNDPTSARRTRITTAVVGSAVAVVIAVTAFGALRSTAVAGDATTPSPIDPAASASPSTAVPDPSATVAAPLESEAPIRTDLTAEVSSMTATTVKAAQPGEIGGPAVRFAITVTNTTDAPVSLSDTVVNVAAGADDEPGYPIDSASTPFPASVPAGSSVTGVYVFTIPTEDRAAVTVTLDTSTKNPVVAFTGAAPR